MDHGWITTLGSQRRMTVQISVATEDGSRNTAFRTCRSRWSMVTPPGGDETGRLSLAELVDTNGRVPDTGRVTGHQPRRVPP
jgi:hypothetical protein